MTPGKRLIPEVDGLRFVAISTVVLFHVSRYVRDSGVATGEPGALFSLLYATGYYGVQLFFGLSGFLLALPFVRAVRDGTRVPLRAYFARRLTRLEPPYVVMLLSVFALDFGGALARLIAAVGYQHTLIFGEMYPPNGATWSLETEVQFYVLAPLLSRIFLVRSALVRRGTIVVAMLAAAVIAVLVDAPRWFATLPVHIHEFLVGYLLADLYVNDWQEAPSEGRVWDVVSAVGWPLLPIAVAGSAPVRIALPFLVLALYCAALRGPFSRRVFRAPLLVAIGGMCYSIYLLHGPVMRYTAPLVTKLVPRTSIERAFLAYASAWVPLVLVISTLYFLALERPCMNPRWPALAYARCVAALRRARYGIVARLG